jgi:Zinc carboxypeptidase
MGGSMQKFAFVVVLCLLTAISVHADTIPSPEEHFGHVVGADRTLIPYPDVLAYLELVAAASDRVSIEEAGTSTLGNRMPVVVLTSAANQARLDEIREQSRQIAKPDGLTPKASERLIDNGVAVALVTCTIHSSEVGSTQMTTEFVHEFATTEDPERLTWMDEAVLLLMPSINPDGQIMIADWYEERFGTEYEGGRMPWLYHHYVGHDNNRDFYALTQTESRVVNDVLYHRWFPQVFLDEHQMGSTGPRMFVPPQTDPLDPEVHSLVFRMADGIGTNMSRRLEENDKTGVGHNMIFDSYWPGGTRNTAWWKNVTGLLTEVASVRIATPIYIDPGELRGGGKGFPEYGRRSNFPSPWEGGWWRLRDIVEYELVATWAYLEAVAEDRKHILTNVDRMAREAIDKGSNEAPYAFIVPPDQHDEVAARKMVALLLRHGVEIEKATKAFSVGYATYPAGTVVIPAAQAYRPFLLVMLRPQRYPEVRPSVNGPIIEPYDVASWSLPLTMGVDVIESPEPLDGTFEPIAEADWHRSAVTVDDPAGSLIPAGADALYTAVNRLLADGIAVSRVADTGDVWIDHTEIDGTAFAALADEFELPTTEIAKAPEATRTIGAQRVGLFKPWVASMDEGWTRWVLEQYEFPMVNLSNEQIRSGEFTDIVDVLLFPDVEAGVIAKGVPGDSYWGRFVPLPPEYSGGIDEWKSNDRTSQDGKKSKQASDAKPTKGGERIKEWVEDGGTIVALDSSSDYFIDLFELPVKDVAADANELVCPGSTLRVDVDTTHPLGWGLRTEEAIYFADSPAFKTSVPDPRFDRHVIARYPEHVRDILLSGYLEGGEILERRAAVIEYRVGEGRVVLIGFRAQHRGQPLRTFKLLFNALYDVGD